MIIASLLFYPLKFILFVLFPIILTVRALEYKRSNDLQEQNNRKKYLILLALTFVTFSLLQKLASTYEYKCYILVLLFIGGMVAKEKGFIDKGMEKLKQVINKQKTS